MGVALVVAFAAGEVTAGALGATVSTVKGTEVEAWLVPSVVVAVAATVCGPSASAGETSHDQVPVEETVAVQAGVLLPSTYTRTSAPGVPVPDTVGVVSLVDWPRVGETMTGGPGGVAGATVKLRAGVDGLALPAGSVAVAVR